MVKYKYIFCPLDIIYISWIALISSIISFELILVRTTHQFK